LDRAEKKATSGAIAGLINLIELDDIVEDSIPSTSQSGVFDHFLSSEIKVPVQKASIMNESLLDDFGTLNFGNPQTIESSSVQPLNDIMHGFSPNLKSMNPSLKGNGIMNSPGFTNNSLISLSMNSSLNQSLNPVSSSLSNTQGSNAIDLFGAAPKPAVVPLNSIPINDNFGLFGMNIISW
jgi:hypothetical protein